MSIDRFVRFDREMPKRQDVRTVLTDYLGIETTVKDHSDRLFVVLTSQVSHPFSHIGPATPAQRAAWQEEENEVRSRFFEVVFGDDYVNVLTRQADRFTSVVAQGFVEVLCHGFDGKEEEY